MRRRAPSARFGHAGFTLVELLIAITIVAVLSVMLVVVATPSEAALAKNEARRLAALLELALAEARASGQAIAWAPEQGGYAFWRRGADGEWSRFPEGSEFGRRAMPSPTRLQEVSADAQPLPEGERVLLPAFGLRGALEATIAGGNARFAVRAGVLGRVTVQAQDDSHAGTDLRRPPAGPRVHPG